MPRTPSPGTPVAPPGSGACAPWLSTPQADRRTIHERIRAITPGGGTALYDSLYAVAGMLQSVEGRRAMVLLSDGRDQALIENEPGSLRLFEEALERAHRVEMAIYA